MENRSSLEVKEQSPIKSYEELIQLVGELDRILVKLEKWSEEVPCIDKNLRFIRAHETMLAIELGCENQ